MRTHILDEMQRCKQKIEDKASRDRCRSSVGEMRAIIRKYRRGTLHPHNFYLSMEDVGRIPDIRKAIVNGTDEEFNICVKDVICRLPELTSNILEERTAKVLALLPLDQRPDNVLSLAAVWFIFGPADSRSPHLMDGTEALSHRDPVPLSRTPETPIGEETFDRYALGQYRFPQESMLSFSEAASTIARGLILDCSEDPESITSAEMDSKFHRFGIYKNDKLVARNWRETVRVCGWCLPE